MDKETLFKIYVVGFMDHACKQNVGCDHCHKNTMVPIQITQSNNEGVKIIYKCSECGHVLNWVISETCLRDDFNVDFARGAFK